MDAECSNYWTNGTALDWIGFWRGALVCVFPATYQDFTDRYIADSANTAENFYFFDDLDVDPYEFRNYLPRPRYNLSKNLIAISPRMSQIWLAWNCYARPDIAVHPLRTAPSR